jgi:hypothetical protein
MQILFILIAVGWFYGALAALNVRFNQTSCGRFLLVKNDQVVYNVPSVWMQVAPNV